MRSDKSSSDPAILNSSILDSTKHRDSLHQHLHAYALAASAAGVTMLALAQPSAAEIIYTPANVTIGPNQSYGLDLNGDGIIDFTIVNQFKSSASTLNWNLFVENPGGGNAVAGFLANSGGVQWAYAFYSKFPVTKAQRHFISSSRATMAFSISNQQQRRFIQGGSWNPLDTFGVYSRYLGLKFTINGKIHYGWAQLSTETYFNHSATLTGYAYETIPNRAIKTGQQQGTETDVGSAAPAALTQPAQRAATLRMLAHGTGALSMWRQKQAAADGK